MFAKSITIKTEKEVFHARVKNLSPYFLGIGLGLLTWWLTCRGNTDTLGQFGPGPTFDALGTLLQNGRFWEGTAETMKRLGIGLGIAAALGIPIGLLIGYFGFLYKLSYVSFQFLRMISPLSWTPVAIILLGIGSKPVYFLVAVASVWPIILNTVSGIHSIDPKWLEAARCMGASHLGMIRFVLIRAALPHILSGIQLAFGVAWIVLVPAEMLGVASGLGYMILDFRDVNDYASITAVIMVIGVLGAAMDLPLKKLTQITNYFKQ